MISAPISSTPSSGDLHHIIREALIYLKVRKYHVNTKGKKKKITMEDNDIKRAAISNLGIDIW